MLSYQHHYHAGNHADVIKHWILVECITYFQLKDKPFDYIDTHAGAGLYDLQSKEALKTGESINGILKLEQLNLPGLENYQEVIRPFLVHDQYPGSPLITKQMLRYGDHAWLYEMHPQTIVELKEHCEQRKVCYVKFEDGFKGLTTVLPTQSKRAMVLIDPSYEIKSDYLKVVEVIVKAHKKAPNTTFMLWYPVVKREQINELEQNFKQSGMKNIQLFEMGVADDEEKGMTASGMIIVNPPWTLAKKYNEVMPEVSKTLSDDNVKRCRFEQLVEE